MTIHATSHTAPSSQEPALPGFADARTLAEIRRHLESILSQAKGRAENYSPHTALLWDQISHSMEHGKLTRPALVFLGYQAFAGRSPGRAMDLACAFELLHTALLMHDDVIDRDYMRRGQPTLSAHYRDQALAAGRGAADAEHLGNSAAVIAGDLLLAEAIKLAARSAHGLDCEGAVEDAFHQAIVQAGAGELEDLLYSLLEEPATTGEVLRMEELKTAAYSFQLPLQAGALLAGASAQQAQRLGSVGCQLGIAYQVIDDVLGTFGEPEDTGKPNDSDLREAKSTILISLASEQEGFSSLLASYRTGNSDLQALRHALEESGAEQFARKLANELCASATRSATFLRLPAAAQRMLHECTTLILGRSS
ncbi:polyprenyl synthetase family protein [Glutamicibacter arilaitensis]|uniref:polyprenyl synthetase family protein n=1 Tax=Glutamicibacter arilaitensis TaxID=256701 RepID=UPI00384ED25D